MNIEMEISTPYSYYFDFWPDWLYQYFNELTLGESIESNYITWNPEQHILTPKYDIMSSFGPLVNHYYVDLKDNDIELKKNLSAL